METSTKSKIIHLLFQHISFMYGDKKIIKLQIRNVRSSNLADSETPDYHTYIFDLPSHNKGFIDYSHPQYDNLCKFVMSYPRLMFEFLYLDTNFLTIMDTIEDALRIATITAKMLPNTYPPPIVDTKTIVELNGNNRELSELAFNICSFTTHEIIY